MTSSEEPELPVPLLLSAETLFERLYRSSVADARPMSRERLESILGPWSRAFARGDLQSLSHRLSWDGISAQQAAMGLGDFDASHFGEVSWLEEFALFSEEARGIKAEIDGKREGDAARWRHRSGNRPFLELVLPWVLAARAGVLDPEGRVPKGVTCDALEDLSLHLLSDLGFLVELAAFELFDGLRKEGLSYDRFVLSQLEQPIPQIYRDYPMLLRGCCTRIRQWRQSVVLLSERFSKDRQAVEDCFFDGRGMGDIRGVRCGISDRHEDGQEVFLLELECGESLVYKPRSIDMEWALGEFFEWCRLRGLSEAPRAPITVVRDSYGWQEMIRHEGLKDKVEAGEYFRRAGSLAALAYLLRAQDLHSENLIATSAGPVVIDGEMFLQPLVSRVARGADGPPHQGLTASCLGTGLLTQPEWRSDGGVLDKGGIRDVERRFVPKGARRWIDANSDSMRVEMQDLWVEPGESLVTVAGQAVSAEQYRGRILDGFEDAYRLFLDFREELLEADGPLSVFQKARVRILFRRSQDYAQILSLRSKPRYLRSGTLSSLVHEASLSVFSGREEKPWLWPLVADEREALERGDIPHFTLAADGVVLSTRTGIEISDYFSLSGIDAVKARVRALDEEDLAEQLALVARCLEPSKISEVFVRKIGPIDSNRDGVGFEDSCLLTAFGIGDLLIEGMRQDPTGVAGWSLGEGRLGIALFFAALARQEASSRFESVCLELVAEFAQDSGSVLPMTEGLGGFSGFGSIVYALSWISEILGDREIGDLAFVYARGLTEDRIRSDRLLDVEGGASGSLLGLLTVLELRESKELEDLAHACAEQILGDDRRRGAGKPGWSEGLGVALTGFAHGASGMARALATYGERVCDRQFRKTAIEALDYERALYDEHQRNWPMLSRDSRRSTILRSWRVGWCHGAPGVALGRLLLPSSMMDAATESELESALTTTASRIPVGADHLCCGSLGRSSILLSAAERLGRDPWRGASRKLVHETMERARRAGDFRLSPVPLENLRTRFGFLKGLAGIGYQLLRSSGAAGLPDVLGLESPSEMRAREKRR